jgi:hypothetical protein
MTLAVTPSMTYTVTFVISLLRCEILPLVTLCDAPYFFEHCVTPITYIMWTFSVIICAAVYLTSKWYTMIHFTLRHLQWHTRSWSWFISSISVLCPRSWFQSRFPHPDPCPRSRYRSLPPIWILVSIPILGLHPYPPSWSRFLSIPIPTLIPILDLDPHPDPAPRARNQTLTLRKEKRFLKHGHLPNGSTT